MDNQHENGANNHVDNEDNTDDDIVNAVRLEYVQTIHLRTHSIIIDI